MIRVVICDDARSDREVLSRMIQTADDIAVVGTAESGDEVLNLLSTLEPDVLTMDINLPGRSGLEVIDEVMAVHPLPVLVISDQADRSEIAMEALAGGAVEVHLKPTLNREEDFDRAAVELTALLRVVARAKVIRHLRGHTAPESEEIANVSAGDRASIPPAAGERASIPPSAGDRASIPPVRSRAAEIVVVAASTGGPQALREIMSKLGPDISVPIIVVQHIASGFTEGLADWLSGAVQLSVKLADDGEELTGGVIYVAPEERHMKVRSGRAALEGSDPVGGHCPSADVLFESVAEAYGERALAVILTGMGRDGAAGLKAIRDAGGTTLVQDEASCAVFGMPKAALDLGAADTVVPLGDIATEISDRTVRGVKSFG